MFQKPIRIKAQTIIKGSDRKRLRVDIQQSFPRLSEDGIKALVPSKDDMTIAKVTTHSTQILAVYCLGRNPIFYSFDKIIFPTVYTLWMHPDLVPCFSTWPPVFTKLTSGADLMLPGVVVRGEITAASVPDVRAGDCCSIHLVGNSSPVAVGVALMSRDDMVTSSMKGKGVKVSHCYGDHLWAMGDKSDPPMLIDDYLPCDNSVDNTEHDKSSCQSTMEHADVNVAALSIADSLCAHHSGGDCDKGVADAIAPGCDIPLDRYHGDPSADVGKLKEQMDAILYELFLTALKVKITKSDLPMLTSAFYRKCMLSCGPIGQSVDVRQSSFKKLSKFLQEMQSRGFVTVKETSRGVDSIIEVNRSHEQLKEFVPKDEYIQEEEEITTSEVNYQPPIILEMYSITSQLLPLVKDYGFRKGQAVSGADIRQALTEYIKQNDLQDPQNKSDVRLDPIVAQVVLQKHENDVIHVSWEDLIRRCMEKTNRVYQISINGQPPVTHKGSIEPICMDVKLRASNKKVTTVDNVELYGIDPGELSQRIKHSVSCSVNVVDTQQKSKGRQVVVQGNQVDFVTRLLLDDYQLHPKFIKGAEKAIKKKKK